MQESAPQEQFPSLTCYLSLIDQIDPPAPVGLMSDGLSGLDLAKISRIMTGTVADNRSNGHMRVPSDSGGG